MSKKLHGFGINDVEGTVSHAVDGRRVVCPYYRVWHSMITRAYCPKFRARYPSYAGTTVCGEWLRFSNFQAWMKTQKWQGKQLDKDIVKPGNKCYSPETCCFVERSVNMLLTLRGAGRGSLPLGVSGHPQYETFKAQCHVPEEGQVYLGSFKTPGEAYAAYALKKASVLKEAASQQSDLRVANGLNSHAISLLMDALKERKAV